jgi:hypothetical protein
MQGPNKKISEEMLALTDSNYSITHYFRKSLFSTPKKRFNHFVIIPVKLTTIAHQNRLSTLDYDSNELINFSANTILLLQNSNKKTLPVPLLTDNAQELNQDHLQEFSFVKCVSLIQNEVQFEPCFDVVGHGTPEGIGTLDPVGQIFPELFAQKMDLLFTMHGLKPKLLNFPFQFHFHTCNSAYAEVNDTMTKPQILSVVLQSSYIGRFYAEMAKFGYSRLSVVGYRGYYSTMNSSHSASARVQNSFTNPSFECAAPNSQYYIQSKQCTSDSPHLTFPVEFMQPSPAILAIRLLP